MSKKYYDALDAVLDRPIAFNPSFKKITGSTNSALLLSQAFYWSKRTNDPDGWFHKTREEWMEETGLTESELDGAREKCRSAGVMEEKLKGVPATVNYRVVKQKVYELLGVQFPEIPESSFPGNSQIPENLESGTYGDFNKNTENTTGNTTTKPDLVDLELAKLAKTQGQNEALTAFERDLQLPASWTWYPAKSSEEKEWASLREFVEKTYQQDPAAFAKYQTWRTQPYARGAMSNRAIKISPADFPLSFSDFLASSAMYGGKQQAKKEEPKNEFPTMIDGRIVR